MGESPLVVEEVTLVEQPVAELNHGLTVSVDLAGRVEFRRGLLRHHARIPHEAFDACRRN
jgi:hypothetical protein